MPHRARRPGGMQAKNRCERDRMNEMFVASLTRARMHILKKKTAPRYQRPEGITSYLLASPRNCDAVHLTTTLAVIAPGGEQRIHSHPPEQVYFILEGAG